MRMTGTVMTSCVSAEMRAFSVPVRKAGIGRPIMPPMATYISGMSSMIEEMRRRFIDA